MVWAIKERAETSLSWETQILDSPIPVKLLTVKFSQISAAGLSGAGPPVEGQAP